MPLDDTALQRLIEQGRATGRVTTDDIHRAFPVGAMTQTELAVVIERLDAAGIDVGISGVPTARAHAGEPLGHNPAPLAGEIEMELYRGPSVAEPGAQPSEGGWIGSHDHGSRHGSQRAPTWEYHGVDMIPVAAMAGVALVLTVALG